ncbi:ATP-binding protein [Stieleria sp. TO1_6]|nr:ATP-binding protein [Stieleria tagensis]
MPIRWKLFATTAVVGLVAALIAISGLTRMQLLNDRLNQIVYITTAKSKLASLMKQELVAITRAEKNMILAKSEEEMERHVNMIDATLDEMAENEAKLRPLVTDETRDLLDQFLDEWEQWQRNHNELRQMTRLNSDVKARELSVGLARKAVDELDEQLSAVAAASAAASGDTGDPAAVIAKIRLLALQLQRIEKNLILASDSDSVREFETRVQPLRDQVREQLDELAAIAGPDNKAQVESAAAAFARYVEQADEIRDLMGESGNYLVFHLAYSVGGPLGDASETLLDAIVAASEAEINELQRDGGNAYRTARYGLLAFSVLGIAASLLFSFVIGDRFTRNLRKLAAYAREIHDARDLSRPIPNVGHDEVGQVAEALDEMRRSLYQQTKKLARLNDALTDKTHEMEQFVYTVSHDLKSPLVSCKGLLGLLKEDLDDQAYEDVIDSANRMEVATDQMSQIIDDLLELSRIGRKPLDYTLVDVNALLTELAENLSDRLESSNIKLQIANDLPKIQADESDLRRVFDNLITNAIKYAGDVEHPLIQVGATESPQTVRYFVRDNGPGIEADYQEKIFGLFQRLENTKEGTGLGLASVRKTVRMHAGKTWVQSEPNQGATFWVELPKR